MINNLIQLKDAMDKKMTFVIVKHYIHPNCDALHRMGVGECSMASQTGFEMIA